MLYTQMVLLKDWEKLKKNTCLLSVESGDKSHLFVVVNLFME